MDSDVEFPKWQIRAACFVGGAAIFGALLSLLHTPISFPSTLRMTGTFALIGMVMAALDAGLGFIHRRL